MKPRLFHCGLLVCLLLGGFEASEGRGFQIIGVQEEDRFLIGTEEPLSEESLLAGQTPDDPNYYVDAGWKQGLELGSILNVYRRVDIGDAEADTLRSMRLLIGTLEVIGVDESTSLTKVASQEPMRTLNLDFNRFMVGDHVAPSLKLDSAVMFAAGASALTSRAAQELERAAKQIKAINPREIVVEGHTDNTGDPKVNYQLSFQRAQNVKDFLVGRGVAEKTIKAVGYGDTRPVSPNDYEENKMKNRRIELVFWE